MSIKYHHTILGWLINVSLFIKNASLNNEGAKFMRLEPNYVQILFMNQCKEMI